MQKMLFNFVASLSSQLNSSGRIHKSNEKSLYYFDTALTLNDQLQFFQISTIKSPYVSLSRYRSTYIQASVTLIVFQVGISKLICIFTENLIPSTAKSDKFMGDHFLFRPIKFDCAK